MNLDQTNKDHAKRVAAKINASNQGSGGILGGIWQWINGVASGVNAILGNTILDGFKTLFQVVTNVYEAIGDVYEAIFRIAVYTEHLVWRVVMRNINQLQARVYAKIAALRRYLLAVIFATTQQVLTICMRAVNVERRDRIRDVKRAEHQARQLVKALHQTIEREAASGYRAEQHQRVSEIVKLLEFAATRVPAIRTIVGDIATALLDLLTIDDPIARIALGFLIKHVIDKLGIDKVVGDLISELMAPFLGKPEPRDLNSVIMDIGQRLNAIEAWQATFMKDGGAQIEQAGTDWRNITSAVTSLAIVGFTVQAVADPARWASEIAGTIGVAADAVMAEATKLFKG